MKNKKIVTSLLSIVFLSVILMFIGCAGSLNKELSNLNKISLNTEKIVTEITNLTAPKIEEKNIASDKEQFVTLVSNGSAEMVVKQAEVEENLTNLHSTNNNLKLIIKTLEECKKKINNEDNKIIKQTKSNIETINNNINLKSIEIK